MRLAPPFRSMPLSSLARIAVAAVAITLVASCSSSGGGSPSATGNGATATTAPPGATSGGPVPAGFVATSVTFVSANQGFVLGASPCPGSTTDTTGPAAPCASLAATDDGGRTWVHRPAPPVTLSSVDQSGDADGQGGGPDGVSRIRFGDAQNGWAFGPVLWATHDGGDTWNQIGLGGAVTDLASAAGVTYALVAHCDAGPCGQGSTLYRTDAGTDDWQSVEGVTLTSTGGTISLHDQAAWIVGESDGPGQNLLSASADGSTWTTRPDLCGAEASLIGVAPVTTVDLFVLCADSPGAGSESKRVLRSSDGGLSAQAVPTMPSPSGITYAIAAADAEVVVVSATSGASWIYRTGDAGATWAAALTADDDRLGLSELGFTTADQGVVIRGRLDDVDASGTELLMTHDAGRTWAPVTFG
jgi:hypothetical protein